MDADFEKHNLTVAYDADKTTPEAMKNALEKAGFPVEGKAETVK